MNTKPFPDNLSGNVCKIDPILYAQEAYAWDEASIDARLGPSYDAIYGSTIPDDRPTHYKPQSKSKEKVFARINPWELGPMPYPDGDYWSDSGQVGYVPDDPANDPGLDRVGFYAYYSKVFALSPRLDYASGVPHPERHTWHPKYVEINGGPLQQPIAMVRGTGLRQNEALVIYRDGFFGLAGTQTSRHPSNIPFPGFKFPAHKVPTALAITTENEFALVTIWDTEAVKGQLAVIALEGKYLPTHTMPHMGLPNQGSWSDFKLLGYVDLPMATPTSVAAASNGFWNGPSATGGKNLGALKLDDDVTRQNLYNGSVIAKGGYAIVASKQENMVVIVDLTRLFIEFRERYLSSATSFAAALAARGPGPTQFPEIFSDPPLCKVIWQRTYDRPTSVLAGHFVDRWSKDCFKAYVATENGRVHIINTSSIMARATWHVRGVLDEMGSFYVGRNPISMTFARRAEKNLPLVPANSNSGIADCHNSVFWVACRGDRAVKAAHTFLGLGHVHMAIQDKNMGDPVAVSTAERGPILSIADFAGKKILSFRIGPIVDARNKVTYGCGADGNDPFEFVGELSFPGKPFLLGSANVN